MSSVTSVFHQSQEERPLATFVFGKCPPRQGKRMQAPLLGMRGGKRQEQYINGSRSFLFFHNNTK